MILSYLVAAGITLAGPQTSGETLKANLTFEPYSDTGSITNMYGGQMGRGIPDRSARYAKQYQVPAALAKSTFFKISITTRDYVAVIGKSKAELKTDDLMFIDWNSDKQFSESEQAKPLKSDPRIARYSGQATIFMPASFDGGIPKVAFSRYSGNYLAVIPAGMMVGAVNIGGKEVKVGFVDNDGNGSYGDTQNTDDSNDYQVGDSMMIDLNGNGKLDSEMSARKISDLEQLPFSKVTRLTDQGFYSVEVDPDGAWAEFTPYTGPWTTLTLKGAKADGLYLTGDEGTLILSDLDAAAKIPALKYQLSSLSYKFADAKGKNWNASVSFYDRKTGKPMTLKPSQENVIKCGAPFAVTVDITSYMKAPKSVAGVQNLSVGIKDAGGHELNGLTFDNGKRPNPPTMVIKDSSGKVVKALKFSYG